MFVYARNSYAAGHLQRYIDSRTPSLRPPSSVAVELLDCLMDDLYQTVVIDAANNLEEFNEDYGHFES